jgi:FkbM family methyltransferase
MLGVLKQISNGSAFHRTVTSAKKLWYGDRGEPIRYGRHTLRYVPGTRPVRLKYLNSPDITISNDVRQIIFFLQNIQSGDFVLDVGGHYGQYAALFASLVSESGRVITFEPDPAARELLHDNLVLNGCTDRVEIESLALFDRDGEHCFFSHGADSMSSLMRSGLGSNASSPRVNEFSVPTTRLDEYLARKNLGSPQWVKLDTEGAEINILRGARQLLRSGATIVCELHPYAWPEFGTSFAELLRLVQDCGRKIEYLDKSLDIEEGAVYGSAIIT